MNQRSSCQHPLDHRKIKSSPQKKSTALLTMPKPLTMWITTNCGKFLEMRIWDHLTCLQRNLYAGQEATGRTGHGTTDWFQTGKGVCQSCMLSPFFNLSAENMRNADWMKHKLESRLLGEISITFDMQMIPLMAESEDELKILFMRVKEECENTGLKLSFQKTKIIASISTMANRRSEKWKQWQTLFFGLQNHCRWWLQPWN